MRSKQLSLPPNNKVMYIFEQHAFVKQPFLMVAQQPIITIF